MAAPGADVRSLPALAAWLTAMTDYRDACADAVAGINQEVRRGYEWIDEQTSRWQRAVRECEEEVTQAKAELAARKFPGWDGKMPDTTLQERNLRRAKARLEHAEDKVSACKKWAATLPKMVDEVYSGSGHRLSTLLDVDVARGLAVLARRLDALQRYAELKLDVGTAGGQP
jgi:uncharacterized protein YhdP